MNLDRVTSGADVPNDINVIIEIPSHSDPVKYEVDKETGAMFVDRFMNTAMYYPCNYGYIPHTLSEDGDFSWEEVECLGACVNAPMIQIFSDTYEDLSPEAMEDLLDKIAEGQKTNPGPQIDRIMSAPEGGLTSLNGEASPAKKSAPTKPAPKKPAGKKAPARSATRAAKREYPPGECSP